ncbi:transporter substrate-binding domain-containing protein [Butyrivibrio sp. FC2001]|uniref:transporter substrate-binding domain-containing protein n=1 Tax=Butyrivibrio sp. FC2001 TaxID=1280671 RepID=UPI000415D933|nr:transporter substrate-binding domain-containing protein [Butyrivibrio sp. FC2001]
MKKKMLAMVMSLMMVAATGCGGSGAADTTAPADNAASTEAPADNAASTEAPAEEATEEAAATDASGKVWKIATDTAFKPFEYTDDSGNFVGIDMDILDAIAKDQGFQYEMQVLGWDASIAACQAGQADGMIAGASITEERKSSGWIFSDGYYDANQSMAVEASSDITGFDGLSGQSVAVKTGSMSATYAESLANQYGFTVTYFEDSPTMYQAVVGGQVAAVFDDTPIMAANIKDTGISMKIVDGTGNEPAAYGFAIFNADNQELVDMFNKGLANIKANGTYDEILKKYLGE